MSLMASQITSLTIVYSTVYSGADQRKLQSSASLAFVRGIHRGPMNSPHKMPVTRKMFPFDDVIMYYYHYHYCIGSPWCMIWNVVWRQSNQTSRRTTKKHLDVKARRFNSNTRSFMFGIHDNRVNHVRKPHLGDITWVSQFAGLSTVYS